MRTTAITQPDDEGTATIRAGIRRPAVLVTALTMTALTMAALTMSAIPSPASGADESTSSTTSSTKVEVINHTLLVETGYSSDLSITDKPGPARARSARTAHCGWFEMFYAGYPVFHIARIDDPEVGRNYLLYCWDSETDEILPGYPVVGPYSGSGMGPSVVTSEEVALHAMDQIEFEAPAVVMSPPGTQLVGVPTWFAVTSRVDYDPISAAAGPVWASVRPVLRNITFGFDNGDTFVCGHKDATTLWNRNGRAGNCVYTFESDGDGTVRMKVTAKWTIWQQTNLRPTEHYWGTHTRTTVVDVDVRELQAVIDRWSCCPRY